MTGAASIRPPKLSTYVDSPPRFAASGHSDQRSWLLCLDLLPLSRPVALPADWCAHTLIASPAMALSDYLVTDDLTIILALVAAGLFLLHNLYKPQALVHPILLGRQSDVARVRNPSESAVYRNYGTGMLGRVSTPISSTPAACKPVAVPVAPYEGSAGPA